MDGRNIIGQRKSGNPNGIINIFGPGLQRVLEGSFHTATDEDIDTALKLATDAHKSWRHISNSQIANFLNAIADEIMTLGDSLIQRAIQESGLPEGRIKGERGRTINQIKMFANLVEEGSWLEATIDPAIPDRTPMPRADIRKMLQPIGPVVVFTASNFPLAFSTAGGDTIAALAAGCPVIVKAHESHLGTNALVAIAIQRAAESSGMPEGVFSSLNGLGYELGQKLILHPLTKAIAFTGSLRGGRAIYDAAAKRESPIPVFAEMGSVNPVLILPDALKNRGAQIANQFANSITLGVGQFCTNPGIIIGIEGEAMNLFIEKLSQVISDKAAETMLNKGIYQNYKLSKELALDQKGVQLIAEGKTTDKGFPGIATVATIKAADFVLNPTLHEEVFGPFSLVIQCSDENELQDVIVQLEGQLTGTVIGESSEILAHQELIENLKERVGRIVFNGVPTGVEVGFAMHHGGPYPASTDARFTSVGADAIKRFARPVCYQDCPMELLPDALKDANPLGIWRKINGALTQE